MLAWPSNALIVLPLVLVLPAVILAEAFVKSVVIVPDHQKNRVIVTTDSVDSNTCGLTNLVANSSCKQGIPSERMTTTAMAATQQDNTGVESYDGGDYTVFVGRGMARFRSGRVAASIHDYDRALRLQPRLAPYMWQRGLSLYYADRFEDGAKQFREDVDVNPNDMEEAIWAFLCEARIEGIGFDGARKRMLPAGTDRRPYMRAAYALFSGEGDEQELAKQMENDASADNSKSVNKSKPAALAPYFYANLYLGLYAEAKGDATLARRYIKAAVRAPYGASGDYMYDLAKVHALVRGW